MLKATKEAKVHTIWVNPYNEYDAAVESFVLGILVERDRDPFMKSLRTFQHRVAFFGRCNALSQLLLKLTSPGVPDIYQGCELWDYSLVDPDNRRPVDYQRRISLLSDLRSRIEKAGDDLAGFAGELLDTWEDGRIKLYVTHRSLAFRRAHSRLFAEGDYLPLEVTGDMAEHAVGFARVMGDEEVLVAVPRLVVRLTGGKEQLPLGAGVWKDAGITLPSDRIGFVYRNIFTGETLDLQERDGVAVLPLAAVFGRFPVALLERSEGLTGLA